MQEERMGIGCLKNIITGICIMVVISGVLLGIGTEEARA
jgi:hypothetical protein